METILSYLKTKYRPLAMILYGSYADGSNQQNSDFDALLVTADGQRHHDVSVVDGTRLDVFVYPRREIEGAVDCADFVQIWDGKLMLDTDGIGSRLQNRVLEHLKQLPVKTDEELHEEIEWCKKMLSRVERQDAEGYFRWHWLLIDSLEIACDILRQPYRGPKKSIRWLKAHQPAMYACYHHALTSMEFEALEAWVACMADAFAQTSEV